MTAFRTRLAALALVSTALSASPAAAQDVEYQTATRVDLAGAAGAAMRLAARLGGGSTEVLETVYIKGNRMRTDVDKSSTILDLEKRRFVMLNHADRSYVSMTFDELVQRAQRTAEEMRDAPKSSSGDGREGKLDFRFSVDKVDERRRVAGYDAERVFLTMEAEGEFVPEGGTEREKAGTLVVLTDMWTSRDIPVWKARQGFDDATARQYAEAGAALTRGLAEAFADDPRMKVAFEQSASEAKKIEGMAVQTVVSVIGVAPGQKFDRALATEPQARGAGAARQAGRAALGRLAAGVAGVRGGQQEREASAESGPAQSTLMRVTTEIRNVATKSLDASLFEIPAGYREAKEPGDR